MVDAGDMGLTLSDEGTSPLVAFSIAVLPGLVVESLFIGDSVLVFVGEVTSAMTGIGGQSITALQSGNY